MAPQGLADAKLRRSARQPEQNQDSHLQSSLVADREAILYSFTGLTDCSTYLDGLSNTLIYNYDFDGSLSQSSDTQRDCLDSNTMAAPTALARVKEILIITPPPNEDEEYFPRNLREIMRLTGVKMDHVRVPSERSFTPASDCAEEEIKLLDIYRDDEDGDELEKAYKTLISCPNVKTLHLTMRQVGGCLVVQITPFAFEFWE
ncbi:hypothetical protein EJ04DRAFT_551145 [Polyplosphaeria fusca]|uniref:Uncharacterized protein n=1 Tax=Polyplosphaeria fusca TaxID=682080 RepID=A0A9P4R511_9PLEO|nr:hypothetical protein EJ04DRAFT_551145 [Polyplosphaeria fusca]